MKNNIIKLALVVMVVGLVPITTRAATVYVESSRSNVSVGDTFVVSVKINAEGGVINTLDGEVAVKTGGTNVAIQEFSLANSAFGLWPRTPSLSKDAQVVSFVGGVPGGFSIEGATVFKIIFSANKEGTVTITPQNMSAYANDGTGTKLPVKTKSVTLTVGSKKSGVPVNDEWKSIVAADTIAPGDFIIVLGQDSSMFDGKKFAFFSALDNQSGISHYDVSENGNPAVRSGSVYVLQDQKSTDVRLDVTAYDKAGNKKQSSYYPAKVNAGKVVGLIVVVLLVLGLVVVLYRKFRGNKNNASPAL